MRHLDELDVQARTFRVKKYGPFRIELYTERLKEWRDGDDGTWIQTGDLLVSTKTARVYASQSDDEGARNVFHELLHYPVEKYARNLGYKVKEDIVKAQEVILLDGLRRFEPDLWPKA